MGRAIEFGGVSKKYRVRGRDVTAVSWVSFAIDEGEFVAIVGSSGSGKSTILQLMSGVEAATEGNIFVQGKDIVKMPSKELVRLRRSVFGVVFQNFYLEPNLTLRQNIEMPAMFAGISDEACRRRTEELTMKTDLYEHLEHRPAELSGGQIQRTAILRAVYNRPKIIIADEPTSNLDKKNALTVLEMIRDLQREMNATVIIATHDESVLGFSDKVFNIENGALV